MESQHPILVFAAEAAAARELAQALDGLEGVPATVGDVRAAPTAAELRAAQLVAVDLDAPGLGVAIAAALREIPEPQRPGLLLVLPGTLEGSLPPGSDLQPDDFVERPLREHELRARATNLLHSAALRRAHAQRQLDASLTLELTEVLASASDFDQILFTLVSRLADRLHVQRVSIVLVNEDEPNVGHVVAASDDHEVSDLTLDLSKYPEVQKALQTQQPLTIADPGSDPVLRNVRSSVPASLSALSLFPIVFRNAPLGVLVLRTEGDARSLEQRELEFCRAIANASAIALRNARVLQRVMRDRDHAMAKVAGEAERRAQALQAYQDLFAAAPDGIAVFSSDGLLQFANPKAYDILGYTTEHLAGRRLEELVTGVSTSEVRSIWQSLPEQRLVTGVDLHAVLQGQRQVTLSTSFSMLEDHSVLVQFREVTDERATEQELRKTKEFLESLIDASIDAIVAADLRGTLILFNKGAERIYGYTQEEVVGKLHVSRLYPEGVAQEVMRKIRSPEFGGEGRLQSMHSCAVDRDGQMIPISLSAAMILENNRPVATVGIFTDLREKLLAEERLAQAQKKLEVSEKQALLAELAGTAAHELNQPLTSVMGYGELLARKLSVGSPERNAAQVIVRETERMADLVRKIGRITRYETKSYVGDQRILDLEKASDEER